MVHKQAAYGCCLVSPCRPHTAAGGPSRRLLPGEKGPSVEKAWLRPQKQPFRDRPSATVACKHTEPLYTIAAEGQVVMSSLQAHPAEHVVSSPEPAVDEVQEEAETSAADCLEHWCSLTLRGVVPTERRRVFSATFQRSS